MMTIGRKPKNFRSNQFTVNASKNVAVGSDL